MKRKKEEIEMPGMAWVLRLEKNEFGDEGYYCFFNDDGPCVRKELGGLVQRFPTEKAAQKAARWLHKEYGVGEEHITPELIAHETTASFSIGTGKYPDGMSLERGEKTGKRFLVISQDGEECTTDDLDDNAADAIVRVFEKLNASLRQTKGKNRLS